MTSEPDVLRRRRILVLRELEHDKATYEAPSLFRDPETWIVNYDDYVEATPDRRSELLAALARQRLLRPDTILLLSPYDETYVLAENAEELFSLRKIEIFTRLCSLLGATEVTALRNDVERSSRLRQFTAGIARGPINAKANATSDIQERVRRQVSVTTRFQRGEPQISAARALLNSHALSEDSTLRGLVELIENGSTRVTSQDLVLNVISEASRELKAAASLKIPTALSISATFEELAKHDQELLVEMRVKF